MDSKNIPDRDVKKEVNNKSGRSFKFGSSLNYGEAGYTSRTLSSYALKNSSLSSWKQFYHQPYKLDYKEATQKAIERKNKDKFLDNNN